MLCGKKKDLSIDFCLIYKSRSKSRSDASNQSAPIPFLLNLSTYLCQI